MSFEVFVRPYVMPPIRPAKPPVLPFQDKPEQGVAVLRGLGGKLIGLTFSESSSWSKSRVVETERTVTRQRIYQKKPKPGGGEEINRENYIDVDTVSDIGMVRADGTPLIIQFADPPTADNIENIEENITITNPEVPPSQPLTGEGENFTGGGENEGSGAP